MSQRPSQVPVGAAGHDGADRRDARALVLGALGKGGGQSLAPEVRADMEARLGADFSDVRLHTGPKAAASAAAISAKAYTVGNEIVFGDGFFTPATREGKLRLAHELTHVQQQRKGPVLGTDNGNGVAVSDPSDKFEQEAEAAASRALSMRPGDRPPGAPDLQSAISEIRAAPGTTVQRCGPVPCNCSTPEREAGVTADRAQIQRDEAPSADNAPLDGSPAPDQSSGLTCGGADSDGDWSSLPDYSVGEPLNTAAQTLPVQRQAVALATPASVACPTPASWQDFGHPLANSPDGNAAHSGYEFFYDNSAKAFNIRVNRPRTWVTQSGVDHDDGSLLRHEQYHFKLACLLVDKANAALAAGTPARKAFSDLLATDKCQSNTYDTETNHKLNKAKQSAWEKDIDANVPAYPKICQSGSP